MNTKLLFLAVVALATGCTHHEKSIPPVSERQELQEVEVVYVPDLHEVHGKEPVYEPVKLPETILFFGDSQACGMERSVRKTVSDYKLSITTRCKVGSRISFWTRELRKFGNYDIVAFNLGSNDYEYPPSQETVDNFMNEVKSHAKLCLWVGPPAIRGKNSDLPEKAFRAAAAGRCSYFDSRGSALPMPDKVHTTPSGYEVWTADSVRPFIDSVFEMK